MTESGIKYDCIGIIFIRVLNMPSQTDYSDKGLDSCCLLVDNRSNLISIIIMMKIK